METRNRGKRAAPPSSSESRKRKATRATRQTTATNGDQPAPSSSARVSRKNQQLENPVAASIKPGSLVADPRPRRSAPAHSDLSIDTRPERQDDDSDEADEEASGPLEDTSQRDAEDNAQDSEHGSEESGPHFDEEEKEVMAESLPDLFTASQKLMKHLKSPRHDNAVFQRLWKKRREDLSSNCQLYQEPNVTTPLIDWPLMAPELNQVPAAMGHDAATILACANLATSLSSVEIILSDILSGNDPHPIPLLQILEMDTIFPRLFKTGSIGAQDVQMALDLRTSYLVEELAALGNVRDMTTLMDHLANAFCEPVNGKLDPPFMLANGPFRGLGGQDREAEQPLYEARIRRITDVARESKKKVNVGRLKQVFQLQDTLTRLKNWILDTNTANVARLEQWKDPRQSAEKEEFHDAEEAPEAGEDESVAESQPIRRFNNDNPRSLFQGQDSVRALEQSRPHHAPPPSNQQQAEPPQGTPHDYADHSTHDLLTRAMPPPPSQPSSNRNSERAEQQGAFEGSLFVNDDQGEEADDDAEDDAFQTDERPVDLNNPVAAEAAARAAKRRHIDTAAPRSSLPSSSLAPPSTMPPPPRPTPSSSASLEAMREAKRDLTFRNRAFQSRDIKQRYAWSDHDCHVLIELIPKRRASWADIQRYDTMLFEHPRNQQAYRDKARNMKVDMLLTDAVLPPGFDGVLLSKKEIDRVVANNKNPYRKEAEIDERGMATGTELGLDLSRFEED